MGIAAGLRFSPIREQRRGRVFRSASLGAQALADIGVIGGLVLRALGMRQDGMIADYLATDRLWRGDPALSRELPPPLRDTLLRAHPELLEAAFTAIDRHYGSFEAYLAQALGVGDAERIRLQALLLE